MNLAQKTKRMNLHGKALASLPFCTAQHTASAIDYYVQVLMFNLHQHEHTMDHTERVRPSDRACASQWSLLCQPRHHHHSSFFKNLHCYCVFIIYFLFNYFFLMMSVVSLIFFFSYYFFSQLVLLFFIINCYIILVVVG